MTCNSKHISEVFSFKIRLKAITGFSEKCLQHTLTNNNHVPALLSRSWDHDYLSKMFLQTIHLLICPMFLCLQLPLKYMQTQHMTIGFQLIVCKHS